MRILILIIQLALFFNYCNAQEKKLKELFKESSPVTNLNSLKNKKFVSYYNKFNIVYDTTNLNWEYSYINDFSDNYTLGFYYNNGDSNQIYYFIFNSITDEFLLLFRDLKEIESIKGGRIYNNNGRIDWIFDIPSGYYKNYSVAKYIYTKDSVYSKGIYYRLNEFPKKNYQELNAHIDIEKPIAEMTITEFFYLLNNLKDETEKKGKISSKGNKITDRYYLPVSD